MTAPSGELLLDADLADLPVQIGVRRGWWTIIRVAALRIIVTFVVPTRLYAPGQLTLAVNCDGYPDAPTAYPIDPATGDMLPAERRPSHGRCALTFRTDWEGGRALYSAVDRVALVGHADWPQKHGVDAWDPAVGIARFLRVVHRDLSGDEDAPSMVAA